MSHRKYEAPRHGSLGFMPKRRAKRQRPRVRSFPKDNPSDPVHLTAFIGFKAGMTHVIRSIERVGSKFDKKDKMEATTIIETPPMVVVGIIGYKKTIKGLKAVKSVFAQYLSDEFKRRLYKRWGTSDKLCFTKYVQKYENDAKEIMDDLKYIKSNSDVIRAIVHTQMQGLPLTQKKAYIMEVQINGGSVVEKVDWAYNCFEKPIKVSQVFQTEASVDMIGVTKGKGYEGVTKRFGTRILPRKSHKGIRKVACIGAWHPSRVMHTVARSGQYGFHNRTELNKRIYRISNGMDPQSGTTPYDITSKAITPMGGFPHYGIVLNDFVMIKGSCSGPRKRAICLRKPIISSTKNTSKEKINIKFIDTSSKIGHGRFQTSEEKAKYYGLSAKPSAPLT